MVIDNGEVRYADNEKEKGVSVSLPVFGSPATCLLEQVSGVDAVLAHL